MNEDKLEQIIRRLESVEQRVAALEGLSRPIPGPPPLLPPRLQVVAPMAAPDRLSPAHRSGDAQDAEAAIGTRVLPWAGAAIVVLGLVYGAKWAVDRGWVTPAMQFAGLSLVSLVFVAVGLWRDRLGEWLGQLLAGVGVAGLLLTAVAGTTTFDLYEGRVAVGMTVFVSLASVAFGAVRGSRGFGALGMVGGLLSSWLPATDQEWGACLFLHALIMLSTAAVAYQRKWPELSMGTWLVGTLTLLPVLFVGESDLVWQVRIGVLYVETLVLAAAYASCVDPRFDPSVAFPAVAAMIAAALGMVVRHGHEGSAHALALALALGSLSFFRAFEKRSRDGLSMAGLLVALVLAPFGLEPGARLLTFTLLALAAGAVGHGLKSRLGAALAWVELCVSGAVYVWLIADKSPLELRTTAPFAVPEPLQLVLMLASCAAAAVASVHLVDSDKDPGAAQSGAINVFAAIVGWLLFARLGRLFLTSDAVGMPYNAALTVSWATYAITLIPLGFWAARKSVRYTGFAILGLTILKILAVDLSAVDLAIRILIQIILGTTMMAVSYFAYLRPRALRQ